MKLVEGVGVNDANYKVRVDGISCKYYRKWKSMLRRCYSSIFLKRNPTYVGCEVCEDWKTFSVFREWMISQEHLHGTLECLELDKDIIVPRNKIYGPDYCCFISKELNAFTADKISNTKTPRGVYKIRDGVFRASCRNPFTAKQIHLGQYETASLAHIAWKSYKHTIACQLADNVKDPRASLALKQRYK